MPTTEKERKGEKNRKSEKNVSKRGKIHICPPSGTKQNIWRGYKTGLYEVMLVWSQKLIQKDAFHLQKMMRKPVEF